MLFFPVNHISDGSSLDQLVVRVFGDVHSRLTRLWPLSIRLSNILFWAYQLFRACESDQCDVFILEAIVPESRPMLLNWSSHTLIAPSSSTRMIVFRKKSLSDIPTTDPKKVHFNSGFARTLPTLDPWSKKRSFWVLLVSFIFLYVSSFVWARKGDLKDLHGYFTYTESITT